MLLTEGIACAFACYGASRRSGPLGQYFWRLITLTFVLWVVAQLASTLKPLGVVADLLFVFSAFPLAMSLFLDPDGGAPRFGFLFSGRTVCKRYCYGSPFMCISRPMGWLLLCMALFVTEACLSSSCSPCRSCCGAVSPIQLPFDRYSYECLVTALFLVWLMFTAPCRQFRSPGAGTTCSGARFRSLRY